MSWVGALAAARHAAPPPVRALGPRQAAEPWARQMARTHTRGAIEPLHMLRMMPLPTFPCPPAATLPAGARRTMVAPRRYSWQPGGWVCACGPLSATVPAPAQRGKLPMSSLKTTAWTRHKRAEPGCYLLHPGLLVRKSGAHMLHRHRQLSTQGPETDRACEMAGPAKQGQQQLCVLHSKQQRRIAGKPNNTVGSIESKCGGD